MRDFKFNLLSASLLLTFSSLAVADDSQLEQINVSADVQSAENSTPPKLAETVKSTKTLEKQQVQDAKDLVRYDPGVTVVEAGRFGSSGFAIRGVEENRVAIQIDGLAQAETISSQGFKELFEGYGNFNNTRNSAEIETLKQVTLRKGADSLKAGSGALGGSVSFETKDARDYLLEKNYYASYKRGYNSADNQHLNTLTLAGRYKMFDAIVVGTTRRGHEQENYGYSGYDERIQGKTREKADPYRRKLDSLLAKVAFQPAENHRFSVMADIYKLDSKGHDFSYTLKPNTQYMTYDEQELRHTHDSVERKNFAFSYENFTQTPLWDTLKITYSQQKITSRARTDDYCDGNEKCPFSTNPLGLHYNQNNQLVGSDNQPVSYLNRAEQRLPNSEEIVNLPTQPYDGSENKIYKWQRVDWDNLPAGYTYVYKGCETDFSRWTNRPSVGDTTPCEATLTKIGSTIPAARTLTLNGQTYDLLGKDSGLISDEQIVRTNTSNVLSCDGINCDKGSIQGFQQNGTPIDIPFEVIERNGQKLAKTAAQSGDSLTAPIFLVPNKQGYQSNLWTQRDLTSKTKQLNLDLTKHLHFLKLEHDLSYGGLWSEMTKSMTNISGDTPFNVKWWALYPSSCETFLEGKNLNPDRHSTLCDNRNIYSFLIPVKTKSGAIYFIDDIRVTDKVAFQLGYRYDRVSYHPEYIPGVTPKIPDDMVTNLYVAEPYFDPLNLTDPNNLAKKQANAEANIQQIAQKKKFSASSYSFGATLDPLNWFRVQMKYGKAFRAPTSDEIYFTFKHPDFSILPNKDLRPETAKTKELSFTLHQPEIGQFTGSVFETRYRDFIDLSYKGLYGLQGHSKLRPFNVYQNVNRPNAKVYGFELQTNLQLGYFAKVLQGFNFSYKYIYQKGRMDGDIPMNAIQPRTAVYGIGYAHPEDKFGFDLYLTHVAAKDAEDTYNMYYKEEGKSDTYIKWRSNSYTTVDLLGYFKPIKNLTLRAGVYNLTNRKYMTWDSARSIRPFGTSNMIDQESGAGINRFYASGRNYRMSVQFEF